MGRSVQGRRALLRSASLVTAVVLLAVVPGLSRSAVEGAKPPPTKARSGDVKDTHQRLKKIYARLGIKRQAVKRKFDESQGCTCKPKKRDSGSKRSSRRWRAPALPPALGYILIGVVVIAMLVPLILALRAGYRDTPTIAEAQALDDEQPEAVEVRGPWEVSLERCRALLREGRLAEAFGALHRVTLVALEREGLLTLDATITNWQYVTRLISKPPLRELLAEVTIAAERSVLGHKPPPASRFDELERLLRERLGSASGGGSA
jgi:hypothetical protein